MRIDAPATPPQPEAVTICLAVVDELRVGRYSQVRELFGPQLRAAVSAKTLRAAWTSEVLAKGGVRDIGFPLTEHADSRTIVRIPITCSDAELTFIASVDDETGLLAGLRLAPGSAAESPWAPPAYADPSSFEEHEVTLGTGPQTVPATLSMPSASGRHRAVVLLAGGGPFDRDETSGRNKPLKDLAWGLASRGVAVLRFDKITHVHRDHATSTPDFTMAEEYLPHAIAAVQLLRQHPSVDADRIFVLGHSMGGKVAPRVAAEEPTIAGLVIMAGDTQPMHWAAVRVMRYLVSLAPDTIAAAHSQTLIDEMTAQAHLIDSDDLSPATPADSLPLDELFRILAPEPSCW